MGEKKRLTSEEIAEAWETFGKARRDVLDAEEALARARAVEQQAYDRLFDMGEISALPARRE